MCVESREFRCVSSLVKVVDDLAYAASREHGCCNMIGADEALDHEREVAIFAHQSELIAKEPMCFSLFTLRQHPRQPALRKVVSVAQDLVARRRSDPPAR